jgi:subtilisin family serine protease
MRWISPDDAADALHTGSGEGVKIALLDSGIETTHPDLAGLELAHDAVVIEDAGRLRVVEADGQDVFGHGTAVAGIIREIAPRATLGSIRVLDGSNRARSEMICEGARFAIERGYHILNCSFGARLRQQVLLFKDWVDLAYLRGVHVVAACNNEDFRQPEWPGDFSSAITVNMIRTLATEHIFRNPPGTLVEFAALGVDVPVAWKNGTRAEMTGSSFAAPRVAGLVARLLSTHPRLPPAQLKALLHAIATPTITNPGLRRLRALHYNGEKIGWSRK